MSYCSSVFVPERSWPFVLKEAAVSTTAVRREVSGSTATPPR
jgi:hypothetical protein